MPRDKQQKQQGEEGVSEEQEPFVDGKRIPLIWPGGCAPVLRRSGLETPEERADRLADAIIRDVYFDFYKQLCWTELMDMHHARARIQRLLREITDGMSHTAPLA